MRQIGESGNARCCGTCRLYSENMFRHSRIWKDARACVADTAHDMPASWSGNNHMDSTSGADCALWEPSQPITRATGAKP